MGQLQVGGTPLRQCIELCGRCNGASVYVKDESKNSSGTFKDRRNLALLEHYKDRGELVFVHMTNGNSGYSLGLLAKEWERLTGKKREVFNIVPKGISRQIREKLERCSWVVDADSGKGILSSGAQLRLAKSTIWYGPRDKPVPWEHWPDERFVSVESYKLEKGYGEIINEIAGQGVKPSFIFCPVGEGELITELAAAAEKAWPGSPPKIIGVTIKQNVLVHAADFIKNPRKSIADKLMNGYSKFKDLVRPLVKSGRIKLMTVSDREIAREYRWLNNVAGISAEPSAAAAFCGAKRYNLKRDDTVVIINTGKGAYDVSSLERGWELKHRLKYAAWAAAGVAVTALGSWIWQSDMETVTFRALQREALLYADQDRTGFLNDDESLEMCRTIPGMDTIDNRRIPVWMPLQISNLTPTQLEFYVRHKRFEHTTNRMDGYRMRSLEQAYKTGAFKCEELHPGVPLMYITGADGKNHVRWDYFAQNSSYKPRH